MKIFNQLKQNELRRELRNNATEFEIVLWSRLKKKQCGGYKFVRQFGIGSYVVDFYCPKKRLVVELDGGQHANLENDEYDKERTRYLNSLGISVLRFWNSEINNNLEGVLTIILENLKNRTPL